MKEFKCSVENEYGEMSEEFVVVDSNIQSAVLQLIHPEDRECWYDGDEINIIVDDGVEKKEVCVVASVSVDFKVYV